MTVTVVLPLPPVDIAPHARGYWPGKSKATREARETAMVLALAATKSSRPMFVKATVNMSYDVSPPLSTKGYRPRDVQNAIASCKAYIDGCKDAGLIFDDSSKYLSWGKSEIVKNGKPGVALTFVCEDE